MLLDLRNLSGKELRPWKKSLVLSIILTSNAMLIVPARVLKTSSMSLIKSISSKVKV